MIHIQEGKKKRKGVMDKNRGNAKSRFAGQMITKTKTLKERVEPWS